MIEPCMECGKPVDTANKKRAAICPGEGAPSPCQEQYMERMGRRVAVENLLAAEKLFERPHWN